MQSAIQLPPPVFQSAEEKMEEEEDTLANQPDLIAEVEFYMKGAEMLAPRRNRLSWRARLQVLADFLA